MLATISLIVYAFVSLVLLLIVRGRVKAIDLNAPNLNRERATTFVVAGGHPVVNGVAGTYAAIANAPTSSHMALLIVVAGMVGAFAGGVFIPAAFVTLDDLANLLDRAMLAIAGLCWMLIAARLVIPFFLLGIGLTIVGVIILGLGAGGFWVFTGSVPEVFKTFQIVFQRIDQMSWKSYADRTCLLWAHAYVQTHSCPFGDYPEVPRKIIMVPSLEACNIETRRRHRLNTHVVCMLTPSKRQATS